jgi:hypothetical protein
VEEVEVSPTGAGEKNRTASAPLFISCPVQFLMKNDSRGPPAEPSCGFHAGSSGAEEKAEEDYRSPGS